MPATRRTTPARTPARPPSRSPQGHLRRSKSRRPPMRMATRIVLAGLLLVACILIWAIAARSLAPRANTARGTFDAIIILGTPADSDGNPTPGLLDRVSEGVHEYERGVAPRLIVTGGPAHNDFVEAEVLARVAHAQGVPDSRIFKEPRARDTLQNACYSQRILNAHGWNSAEIISSASHLPRAAMIFSHLPQAGSKALEWRVHASPDTLTPGYYTTVAAILETLKTARYLVWARWTETCAP